jgi:carbamoyltransferase
MNVVGISAFYHEAACCLLRDGVLIAAAEEERFTRRKHDPGLPVAAFRYCLDAGGLDVTDLDLVAYYEIPEAKLARQLWARETAAGPPAAAFLDAGRPEREIRERLGWAGPIKKFPHHLCHAASAFHFSGYSSAAVMTVDGVGEWATTTYGQGDAGGLRALSEVSFPHSLGLFYAAITAFLGFEVNDGEYKVMGLAPYGRPRFAERLRGLIESGPGGDYRLDLRFFDFLGGRRMYSKKLSELLGLPPREPEAEIAQAHCDLAKSAQLVLEEVVLEKAAWLHGVTGETDLCLAGGVAQNCVANGRLLREGPFRRLFVPPAPGDSGACLGAAVLAYREVVAAPNVAQSLRDSRLGPSFESGEILGLLQALGVPALDFRGREHALVAAVAERIAKGEVVGWFQGRMEFGPRALGARCLLADPRDPTIRERLNARVKRREAFRPFAPSILLEAASEHLALDHRSDFMLETCQVRSPLALPGITHVDGSARPQTVDPEVTPRFAAVLRAFQRLTGCPLLVNTSFNVRGEPIVCTPIDALTDLLDAELDALAIEDLLVDRRQMPDALAGLLRRRAALYSARTARGKRSAVYSFV